MTECGERVIELIVEDIPYLCWVDGVFDIWEDLAGASHIDDRLGVVSSFSPVSQFSTALPCIAFWLRPYSSHDLVSICPHDYTPHILFPHGVVVLGQLRDVAVNAVEGFGRHCAGRWCFRGFEGLGRTEMSGVLV